MQYFVIFIISTEMTKSPIPIANGLLRIHPLLITNLPKAQAHHKSPPYHAAPSNSANVRQTNLQSDRLISPTMIVFSLCIMTL
mmetsp:Transcript_17274/g.34516  ORF Transcript_17274/g.34516 Transcript_17274/m.34516 type:complete len:83 (+) Transcript_17274:26-274(+)